MGFLCRTISKNKLCFKIPNPDQYAIGIVKILILASVWIFQIYSYDTYTKTPNKVYILDRNCPLRTLEMTFQSIKISEFSEGGMPEDSLKDSQCSVLA